VRDVARQLTRNREAFAASPCDLPVFAPGGATLNDTGVPAAVRGYHDQTQKQIATMRRPQRLATVRAELSGDTERVVGDLEAQASGEVTGIGGGWRGRLSVRRNSVGAVKGAEFLCVKDRSMSPSLSLQARSFSTIQAASPAGESVKPNAATTHPWTVGIKVPRRLHSRRRS
jgi:hypothetical protein